LAAGAASLSDERGGGSALSLPKTSLNKHDASPTVRDVALPRFGHASASGDSICGGSEFKQSIRSSRLSVKQRNHRVDFFLHLVWCDTCARQVSDYGILEPCAETTECHSESPDSHSQFMSDFLVWTGALVQHQRLEGLEKFDVAPARVVRLQRVQEVVEVFQDATPLERFRGIICVRRLGFKALFRAHSVEGNG
jgi:hypothetical protein